MEVKVNVQIPTEIFLTDKQVLKALQDMLGVQEYAIKNNELYRYERVGYSDYDYVKVPLSEPRYEVIKKKVEAYDQILLLTQ